MLIKYFICFNQVLMFCRWYFLLTSRVDVERNLMASKNAEGAFLVRPCSTTPDASYALSGTF